MARRIASEDGVSIAYDALGDGSRALVFVHGWSCDRAHWAAPMRSFADSGFRVAALDLAGHGGSGRHRRSWTLPAFGADVVAVMEALQFGDAILVGHSMGADVVLQAAGRLRDRVRGLVWVDEYSQLDKLHSEAEVEARLRPFRDDFVAATTAFARRLFGPKANPALVERVARRMASAPPDIAVPSLGATWHHGREVPALLAALADLPVVAINASHPSNDSESLRHHGIDAIVMDGVGHFPMLERPEGFDACLREAIATIDRRTR